MSATLPSVMFVDDDSTLLESVRQTLHNARERYAFDFVNDPEEAIALFCDQPRQIVVSDLHMPAMSGIDMVAAMMKRPLADQSRFLFLSGAGDFDTALRAINELHVYRFLKKPVIRDRLLEAIDEALEDLVSEAAIGGRHAAAALETINAAVLVVSLDAKLLFCNPAGRRLLDRPGGLTLSQTGVCRAPRVAETQSLQAMIRDTATDPEDRVRWLTIKADEWGRDVNLVAIPREDDMADQSVILMSTEADSPSALSQEAVQELFGLSPAEASIALAISRGDRIEYAALSSGVTVSSARTYLKRVFLKTGVSRQSDLVKKILMSPAALVKPAEEKASAAR